MFRENVPLFNCRGYGNISIALLRYSLNVFVLIEIRMDSELMKNEADSCP